MNSDSRENYSFKVCQFFEFSIVIYFSLSICWYFSPLYFQFFSLSVCPFVRLSVYTFVSLSICQLFTFHLQLGLGVVPGEQSFFREKEWNYQERSHCSKKRTNT